MYDVQPEEERGGIKYTQVVGKPRNRQTNNSIYRARAQDAPQEMEKSKQGLGCWPDLALLGCSEVSLHFL